MRHFLVKALVVSSVLAVSCRQQPKAKSDAGSMNQGYALTRAEQERLAKKAESGDAAAAFVLAEHFSVGEGDYEQHRKWLRRAADLGHPTAEYNLGYALMKEGNLGEARLRLENLLKRPDHGDAQLRRLAESVLQQIDEASAHAKDGKAPSR